MPSIIIKFLTLVLSGALVFQQTTEQREPKTPAECLGAVRELPQKRYEAARAGGQKPDYAEIDKEKTELAKKYASQFSIETLGGKDLAALARLFVEAKEPELARKAVTRSLDIGPRGNGGRADALVTAIEILLAPPYAQESIDQAEAYMAGLDAMGSEFNSQKITGHIRLGGYYRYGDVDEKILLHGRKVLALAARISSAERKTQGARLATSYTNIAEVLAGRGEIAEALANLKQGLKELADVPNAARWIKPAQKRYSLVGQKAAPIEAPRWFNAKEGTRSVELAGKVTLIQFTAHWCAPCRMSYPAMLRYHEKSSKEGLQVLFVTQLYGFFEQRRPLNAEEEIAADRDYYLQQLGLPFKVAITPEGDWLNDQHYVVGGIPQIVVIDRQGIIRRIMTGWDPANEARLGQLIEKLLAEPVASTRP